MQNSISSVLQMWLLGSPKAEIFTNLYLSSLGYERLQNIAPLGGPDGGRDLESLDGTVVVACYFPVKKLASFKKIQSKFMSDMKKAHACGAEKFIFVTGQILQQADKRKLIKLSAIHSTEIHDCTDISNKVAAPESGYLRAELGFPDNKESPEKDFFRRLYKIVDFPKLIELFHISLPPRKFPSGFISFFDSVEKFNCSAEPGLLGKQLKTAFCNWSKAVEEFEHQINDPDRFDNVDAQRSYVLIKMPYVTSQRIGAEIKAAFTNLHQETNALTRLAAEKHRISIH